jgi:hypothetical protein
MIKCCCCFVTRLFISGTDNCQYNELLRANTFGPHLFPLNICTVYVNFKKSYLGNKAKHSPQTFCMYSRNSKLKQKKLKQINNGLHTFLRSQILRSKIHFFSTLNFKQNSVEITSKYSTTKKLLLFKILMLALRLQILEAHISRGLRSWQLKI